MIFENLPKTIKGLRVKQRQMSVFSQLDLTLIEFNLKKIGITAHLAYIYIFIVASSAFFQTSKLKLRAELS